MKRPEIYNYSYRETNNLHTQKYVDDLNLYTDQIEAEKKALVEFIQGNLNDAYDNHFVLREFIDEGIKILT